MEKTNIIFLDVDGVLNNSDWMKERKFKGIWAPDQRWESMINPEAVLVLNDIIKATNSKVVLSSTWRLNHSPEEMQFLLSQFDFTGEIIDSTKYRFVPIFRNHWRMPKISEFVERGFEIHDWLCENANYVKGFVILDDESDMAHLKHRLVKTKWARNNKDPESLVLGLNKDHIQKAINIINIPLAQEELFIEERKAVISALEN